jgi:hypothetical protein
MAEGDFFSLLEEEHHSRSWKFYLSTDLWDWIHRKSNPNTSAFEATNGFVIVCSDKCDPGFGNGSKNTLFLNRYFSGDIGVIDAKKDRDDISDNLDDIKTLFTEAVNAARESQRTFDKHTTSDLMLFPPDSEVPNVVPKKFTAALQMDKEIITKRWVLKMTAPFYDWAVKKKNFTSQSKLKILFDPSGIRIADKTAYNHQKKILLLKGCRDKSIKLPKTCHEHIKEILAALIELSEIYETVVDQPTHQNNASSQPNPSENDSPPLDFGDFLSFLQRVGEASHTSTNNDDDE